jgi:signal transduction histidine kinase/DNA-binding response OmpR family regulator
MNDKINILVVDDLPEKLLVLESILEELGQNVVTARSGEEALRRVLEYDFAVILLDVKMPGGMDGLETAALIRRRKKSAHTPIIFVTAYSADEMHTAKGYSLGAVDYIFSPVMPEVLRTKVRVFVDLFRMTQQAKQQADERVALAREQAARAAAEESSRRLAFLAEAGKTLASSLDLDAALRVLARLPVPFLADLGSVTYVGEPGQPWRTEMAWADPPRSAEVQSTSVLCPSSFVLGPLVERVLSGGQAELVEGLDVAYPPVEGQPTNAQGQGTKDKGLRTNSVLILPLSARGRTLGALVLGTGAPGRPGTADRLLAEDFAERAAIYLDNARLYRDVQEADRRKNEFLSMLAHELRNPLAPIRNAVQILRLRGPAEAEMRAVQDMIDRQVQQLVRLVDDLLDISRITRGKIRLQREPVDLTAVAHRAVETSRPLIDARGHDLTVSLPADPVRVQGDPVRLAQVLGNLLNNAAKYTEDGGQIWLTVEREHGEAVCRVRDTGMGIPPEMLASVFDLFTQVERSLDRSQGGLGIGLTLVKRLVELHAGRVQALSAGPNQGSEFVVRLPALPREEGGGRRDESDNGIVHPSSLLPPPSAKRVLVVDDNVDGADSLAVLLRLGGHEVRVCHDGPAALALADEFRPDLVLLDIGLPGMDGYEVARRLRELPGLDKVPLVALSGYGQEEDVRRSRQAGFDRHLVKPADPAALAALFEALGSGARAESKG